MPARKFHIPRKWRSAITAISLGLISAAIVYKLPDIEVETRLLLQRVFSHGSLKTREQFQYDSWIALNFTKLDTSSYDWLFEHRGPHIFAKDKTGNQVSPSIPEVVIVSIDSNSIDSIERPDFRNPAIASLRRKYRISYPFPRSVYAELIRKLKQAGAAVVGIDFVFNEASSYNPSTVDPSDDREFAHALKESGNVVLASKFTSFQQTNDYFEAQAKDFPVNIYAADKPGRNDALIRNSARASCFVNVPQDSLDSWVRRFHLTESHYDPDDLTQRRIYATFAPMIAALYWNDYQSDRPKFREVAQEEFARSLNADFVRGTFASSPIYFHIKDSQTQNDATSINICYAGYPGKSTCTTHPIDEVLDSKYVSLLPSWFQNKIVLVGSKLAEDQDYYSTPLRRMSEEHSAEPGKPGEQHLNTEESNTEGEKRFGVEVHANIIHTLLSKHYYREYNEGLRLTLILLCGLVTAFLTLRLKPLLAAVPTLVIVLAVVALMIAAFNQAEFLRPTQIVLATAVSYFTETGYFYLIEERKARQARTTFQRYVGPRVMEQVLDTDFKQGTVIQRYLTIMFTDVQGFTSLSEKMSPVEVVETFNRYLNQMVEIIDKHGGTLDKIMGDGVMAYFNAPLPLLNHEQKAVDCALEMQAAMREWRKLSVDMGLPPLKVRIGINSGEVVFGEVGAKRQLGYTVIGDAVNAAARLEPLNKEFGTDILISEAVRDQIDPAIKTEYVGKLDIRGRKEGIRAYSVSGRDAQI